MLNLLRSHGITIALLLLVLGYIVWQRLPSYLADQELVGQTVADFALEDGLVNPEGIASSSQKGDKLRLSDFGGKRLLLYFFATWCQFCNWQMPSLRKIHKRLQRQDFLVLAISSEALYQLRDFQKEHEIAYPIFRDEDEAVHEQFQIRSYPTLVWVETDGKIKKIQHGLNLLLPYTVSYWVTGNPFYDSSF